MRVRRGSEMCVECMDSTNTLRLTAQIAVRPWGLCDKHAERLASVLLQHVRNKRNAAAKAKRATDTEQTDAE